VRVARVIQLLFGVLLLAAIMLLFVFPTRTYLAQRRELDRVRDDVTTLEQRNEALRDAARRLDTPAEIERLAREKYNLVRPGEQPFVVVPAPNGSEADTDDADGAQP
jgi:cell division protein FtsB